MNSRDKGKRGEREAAKMLSDALGIPCRRGQQFSGVEGRDVVGIPGVHIEVKRTESLRLYDALEQAKRDAADDDVPVVLHRKNGKPWVAIVEFDELTKLADLLHFAKGVR